MYYSVSVDLLFHVACISTLSFSIAWQLKCQFIIILKVYYKLHSNDSIQFKQYKKLQITLKNQNYNELMSRNKKLTVNYNNYNYMQKQIAFTHIKDFAINSVT